MKQILKAIFIVSMKNANNSKDIGMYNLGNKYHLLGNRQLAYDDRSYAYCPKIILSY